MKSINEITFRKNRNDPGESIVCCRESAACEDVVLLRNHPGRDILRKLFFEDDEPKFKNELLVLLVSSAPLSLSVLDFDIPSLVFLHFFTLFHSFTW